MAKIVLISHPDILRALRSEDPSFQFTADKYKFEICADVDAKIIKKIDKDPLLNQQIRDPLTKLWNQMIKEMVKTAKISQKVLKDAQAKLSKDPNFWDSYIDITIDETKKFRTFMLKCSGIYEKQMSKCALDGWNKYVKLKKDIKSNKIKLVVDNSLRVGGIVLNAVKAIGAASHGNAIVLILALQGLVKDSVSIINDIIKYGRSIETAQEKISENVQKLKKRIEENDGLTKEFMLTVAASFTGFAGNTCLQVKKDLGVLGKQIDMKEKAVHNLSKTLDMTLNKQQELLKLNSHAEQKAVAETISGTHQLIKDIGKELDDIKKLRLYSTKQNKIIDQLMAGDSSKVAKAFAVFDSLVDLLKLSGGVATAALGAWDKAAKTAKGVAGITIVVGKNIRRHQDDIEKGLKKLGSVTKKVESV